MAKGVYHAPWEKAFDRVLTPLEEFIHRQTTSGVLLMICAVIALAIGNSPLYEGYNEFLETEISIGFGESSFALTIHYWINELLMALFFLVIGLELKRELLVGELSSPSRALLPIMAAIGGMAAPAAFYVLFAGEGHTIAGWGIPMATDIAFAIGALSLLGARVPKALVSFLIALAIVDDLGAVAVIALFYTADLNLQALAYAGLCTLVLLGFNLGGIRHGLPYALIGVLLWACMLATGIHATIAGIVLAFTIPIRPKYDPDAFLNRVQKLTIKMREAVAENPDIIHNNRLRSLVTSLEGGVTLTQAPAQRAEHSLHLPVAYLIIPIFALANAGIPIDFANFGSYLADPVSLGVIAGLLLGKPVGICGMTWLTLKLGLAEMPAGLNMRLIFGVSMLAGIGFTMSIFIADLAFVDYPQDLLMAKTGILMASLVAGLIGYFCVRANTTPVTG